MKNNQLDDKRFQDKSKKYRRSYWDNWIKLYCDQHDGKERPKGVPDSRDSRLDGSLVG